MHPIVECLTGPCATWSPSQSYSEPEGAPNHGNLQTWTYGHSYSPMLADGASSQVTQSGYMTMKQQAFRSVETTPATMPYPIGELSSPGIKLSTETSLPLISSVDAGLPSSIYPSAYQADPPLETQYFLDSVPDLSDTVGMMPIPTPANTHIASILPTASLAFPTSTYMSTSRSCRPHPGRLTIPSLDQSQDYCSQSPIPYCFPHASSGTYSSDLTFSGNPTLLAGTPHTMPYFNYPSPTLPTQTKPVLSFPPTSNTPDSTVNFVFPCNFLESASSSQPTHSSTEVDALTSSSKNFPVSDCKEDEIDVCSTFQYGFNGT